MKPSSRPPSIRSFALCIGASLRPFLAATLLLVAMPGLNATDEPARKRVAIIIDDGPDQTLSAQYHALFARERVRVSFAQVGRAVNAHPELTRAVAAGGHEIVNHSYTHPHFKELDDAAIRKEVADTQAAVTKASGRAPAWFWSPFNEWDDRIAAAVRAEGLEGFPVKRFALLDTQDWNPATTPAQIREGATTGVKDRTIILCHEWNPKTLAEMPAIIAELKRQGVEFVTFSELAATQP
jgi:peptidoglycan/xylan/chitin deacetylase (PgdA/CDA1 family)